METTTTTKPLTYGAAAKVAEPVNTDELRDLIAQDDNPDIFSGKGKQRRIVLNLRLHCFGEFPVLEWEYCNRSGYLASEMAHPSTLGPIFNFERLGRIVRWEAK